MVVFITRIFFLLGVCLLAYSPRLESVYREWKEPTFLILEDDSPSLKYQKTLEPLPSWLKELSNHGIVTREKFSQRKVQPSYSIHSQLSNVQKQTDLRGIFLLSDGQEILTRDGLLVPAPVFCIPRGEAKFADIHLSLKRIPEESYISQNVVFRGTLSVKNAARVQGTLVVKLDGGLIHEIPMDLEREDNNFEFQHRFTSSGERHFQLQFHSVLDEVLEKNNTVEFFVDVLDTRRLVFVVAPAPNPDLAFYLRRLERDSSLQVQTRYLNTIQDEVTLPVRDPDLFFFYSVPFQEVQKLEENPLYSKIPRIFVLGSAPDLVASYYGSEIVELSEETPLDKKVKTWEYFLYPKRFSALNLFEHEGYQRTVLSSFPLLREYSRRIKPGLKDLVPFEVDLSGDRIPLVLVQKHRSPAQVVLNATDLSIIPFSSFARERNLDFFDRMYGNLVQWCIDSTVLRGIDIHVPLTMLEEGEPFIANVDASRGIEVTLERRSGEVLRRGSAPVEIRQVLSMGNYKLILREGSSILKQISIHVGLGYKEFEGAGRDEKNLKKISQLTGGKLIREKVESLPATLGTALLEKKLELRRESVELQRKLIFSLFLLALLCFEWVYRYSRRMI